MALESPDQLLAAIGLWAYVVVFLIVFAEGIPILGTLLPGQLFLLGAAFLIRAQAPTQRLAIRPLLALMLVAVAAAWLGDLVGYWLGKRYGDSILDRLPRRIARKALTLRDSLSNNLVKSLIIGRYLGPTRALLPPVAGAARVSFKKFALVNLLACVLWAFLLVLLGALIGRSYRVLERSLGIGAVILVLVALVVYLGVQRFRGERALDKEEAP